MKTTTALTFKLVLTEDYHDATVELVRVDPYGEEHKMATVVFDNAVAATDAIRDAFLFLMKVSR